MDLRKYDSDLEGHPTPRLNIIDVATGSLGQGLSCAAGMAYTAKHFDKMEYVQRDTMDILILFTHFAHYPLHYHGLSHKYISKPILVLLLEPVPE